MRLLWSEVGQQSQSELYFSLGKGQVTKFWPNIVKITIFSQVFILIYWPKNLKSLYIYLQKPTVQVSKGSRRMSAGSSEPDP